MGLGATVTDRAGPTRGEAVRRFRNRIESTRAPRVTAGNAARTKIGTGQPAVAFERFEGVRRTGRREAAAATKPGTQQQSISANDSDQKAARQIDETGDRHPDRRARSGPSTQRAIN